MKKIFIIAMLFFLIISVGLSVTNIIKNENGIKFSDNIEKYNFEEYEIPKTVFPSEIPSNAQVVSFSYFNYWNETTDIYLELKFKTLEEMRAYLSDLKYDCASNCSKINPAQKNVKFIEVQNIYNLSYEDMFCPLYISFQDENKYTGYKIVETGSEKMRYECNFGLISYSFDELTVIHTYVYGWYRNNVHKHIPEYFKRFDVPLYENHQRVFIIDE